MAKRKKGPQASEKASQEWLVTFGDLITLLITFFVLLISMSSMDQLKLRKTFGFFGGASAALERGRGRSKTGKRINPSVKMTRALRERLGVSPGTVTGSMVKSLERVRLTAARMIQQIRMRNVNKGIGRRPLDKKTLDLLEKDLPVKIVRHKQSVEMDLHVALLFERGRPVLMPGSVGLMNEVSRMLREGATLGSVQISPSEHGDSGQTYSPWDLAIWRSAALIRRLRPARRPPARVAVSKDTNYVKLMLELRAKGS